MKVWIVKEWLAYEGCDVVAVYSNLESAEVFVKSSTEKITDNYEKQRHGFDITEYEVEGRENNATGRNNNQRSSIDVP